MRLNFLCGFLRDLPKSCENSAPKLSRKIYRFVILLIISKKKFFILYTLYGIKLYFCYAKVD